MGSNNEKYRRRHAAFVAFAAAAFCFYAPSVAADAKSSAAALKQKDYPRALEECREAAHSGEKDCQSTLGYLYKNGLGVAADHVAAVGWLKKAAAQGQTNAEEMLGDSYRRGLGIEKDFAEALRLFNRAAAKGNVWALNNLGNLYRFGQGVASDAKEAVRLYRAAAEKGNPAGEANLADMYRLGEGVARDPDQAFQWALRSSKQNWPFGHNVLGLLFRDGVGVRRDSQRAVELFKLAIDGGGVPVAYANLAGIHYHGIGVAANLDEAAKWARMGVEFNDPTSMTYLSGVYRRGTRQIPANAERAFDLAAQAAKQGHPAGLNQLGFYHRDGIGTPVNYARAAELLDEAARRGNADAVANLAFMHERGLGLQKNPERARQDYVRALQMASLSPSARTFAETSLKSLASSETQGRAELRTAEGVAASSAAPRKDEATHEGVRNDPEEPGMSRNELLERLDRLQQQLTSLQAASNTAAMATAVADKTIVFAPRRALVIGNDRYRDVAKLNNAVADAEAMALALERVGYQVVKHLDVDEKRFKQALRDFRSQLQGGDEVLFFFAGHGVQLGHANYLLPVDIRGDSEDQVKDDAIQLQKILDDLEERKTKFALAVIDACRDNPFKGKGRAIGGRGLAPTTAATGQMIMFSAGSGQQALDRLGDGDKDKNGLFTRIFLKEMMVPGVSVDRVLRNVRNEVVRQAKSIGHEQTPSLYDQAIGEFYFRRSANPIAPK